MLADDSDTVFAWQLIAGADFDLTRHMTLYADYHYLATSDPKFTATDGSRFKAEYETHNISVGFRYNF